MYDLSYECSFLVVVEFGFDSVFDLNTAVAQEFWGWETMKLNILWVFDGEEGSKLHQRVLQKRKGVKYCDRI